MEYLNLMLCVMRLSTIFLPAQLRGPRPRKPTWCKGCYCQIIVHCKVIVEQHFTFIFFMFPNFTFGFVMFPSEKSNTSGLVPPAFTWGNSFSSLSAIHLQIHVTNLFVVWHRLPVKNIGHPFLSDPGVSGVRSMGPVVSNWLTPRPLCRLNWCDSGWWRYKLYTNW